MLYADITAPIALEAKGCPEPTIERVLRDVVRQLYRDHAIWIYADAAASVDTDGALTLTLPDDSEVVAIRSMRAIDGAMYHPRTVDDSAFYDWDDTNNLVCMELNGTWLVRPTPAEALTGVKVVAQLAPIYGAVEIVDAIGQRHRQIYEHATLARLLAMAGQKWTDTTMAEYHGVAAWRLVLEAKRKADGWSSVRTPTVRYGGI